MAHELTEGRHVEVVHVRVGQQHSIDRWQVLNAQAGATGTAQQDEPRGKHRVHQQVATSDLQQER